MQDDKDLEAALHAANLHAAKRWSNDVKYTVISYE
jgi:hypothetical protein